MTYGDAEMGAVDPQEMYEKIKKARALKKE